MELGVERWVDSPCKPKRLNFSLLLDTHPTKNWVPSSLFWSQTIYWKKTFLIAFTVYKFSKMFVCHVHFQWRSHSLFEKLLGTKSFNIKQCPAELSARIIHIYPLSNQKCSPPLVFFVDFLSSPRTLCETLGMGRKTHPKAKNLLISPTRKIALNKFLSFLIQNEITPPSTSNFHIITLYKFHL